MRERLRYQIVLFDLKRLKAPCVSPAVFITSRHSDGFRCPVRETTARDASKYAWRFSSAFSFRSPSCEPALIFASPTDLYMIMIISTNIIIIHGLEAVMAEKMLQRFWLRVDRQNRRDLCGSFLRSGATRSGAGGTRQGAKGKRPAAHPAHGDGSQD